MSETLTVTAKEVRKRSYSREQKRRWNRAWNEKNPNYHREYYANMTDEQKEARKQARKTWPSQQPEVQRRNHEARLERDHGMGVGGYQKMLARQGGVCAICQHPERIPNKQFLSVDHCHETGKVRGLLCGHCNVLLGYARDDTENLKAAIAYLEETARV